MSRPSREVAQLARAIGDACADSIHVLVREGASLRSAERVLGSWATKVALDCPPRLRKEVAGVLFSALAHGHRPVKVGSPPAWAAGAWDKTVSRLVDLLLGD